MLSIKTKFWFIEEPPGRKHVLGFETIFNNVGVQTINYSEKFGVWFINLLRFCEREERDCSHKGGGGGGG